MIRDYYKNTQCGFLFDEGNIECPLELQKELEKSGLTYISILDYYNHFCVVNNRFAPDDFRKLMIAWCKRFNQGTVFVTWPYPQRSKRDGQPLINKPVVVKGYEYNSDGTVIQEYDSKKVESFINHLYKSDSALYKLHETHWPSNYTVYGRIMGITNFRKLYPNLSN